jgi:hypothetical protein
VLLAAGNEMPTFEEIDAQREPGYREIDKQQAIRHLLHSSIRLDFDEEDPFAVHLICQSCDKLILDLAKHRQIVLQSDWSTLLKPEFARAAFVIFRETYNYFKHADDDADKKLQIRRIVDSNEMSIWMNCVRYRELFGKETFHMLQFVQYMAFKHPNHLNEPHRTLSLSARNELKGLTRGQVLCVIKEQMANDPGTIAERSEDLIDTNATSRLFWEQFGESDPLY